MGVTPPPVTACCFYSCRHDDIPIHLTNSASQFRMDVDIDDTPFELTELDHLALTATRAHARTLYGTCVYVYDSDDDLLGINDPDLLDIPPPMIDEAWSDGVEGRGTE